MTARKSISTRERVRLFALHGGRCHLCGGRVQVGEAWDISHELPLELGGSDDDENRQIAHRKCHRAHTAAVDAPAIGKMRRREAKHLGARAPSRHPLPGGRASPWKRTINHGWVRRDGGEHEHH